MDEIKVHVDEQLRARGIAHVRGPLDLEGYEALARALGEIVGKERIALRPGAHAYVAKPGAVPLHTDHPDVSILAWYCERQDDTDGATRLLDTRPFVDGLPLVTKATLRGVDLWCPPLAGGPPTERRPVLRLGLERDAIFCPPWVRAATPVSEHEKVLEQFRLQLSAEVRRSSIQVRLAPGAALFIDNQRVLHGRREIADGSRRTLHRRWIRP